MGVKLSYIEFLLKLLNSEENIDIEQYQEELIVNLYLTLLSLSNLEYSEDIEKKEKQTIDDFLRKLNNLKVKIQLKRKQTEIDKLAQELITQYYENIHILSIYIQDGKELEQVINSMDAKKITKLIDTVTKDKMNKEDRKDEVNQKRIELVKLLPSNNYYIENNKMYIKDNETYEEITVKEFIDMFGYLLDTKNYKKLYSNKTNQTSHELIIANIIKLLIIKDKKQEDVDKALIPLLLTHILSLGIDNIENLDTSEFNIENIKITELYSLASNGQSNGNIKTTKWRNISIPNEYLIKRLKEMIKKGMYYYKEDDFVLEYIEDKISDFRISIKTDKLKEFLKSVFRNEINA